MSELPKPLILLKLAHQAADHRSVADRGRVAQERTAVGLRTLAPLAPAVTAPAPSANMACNVRPTAPAELQLGLRASCSVRQVSHANANRARYHEPDHRGNSRPAAPGQRPESARQYRRPGARLGGARQGRAGVVRHHRAGAAGRGAGRAAAGGRQGGARDGGRRRRAGRAHRGAGGRSGHSEQRGTAGRRRWPGARERQGEPSPCPRWRRHGRRAPRAASRAASGRGDRRGAADPPNPRHQAHDRGRLRQGWRRQVHRGGELGAGATRPTASRPASSTPTFTAPRSRACWGSPASRRWPAPTGCGPCAPTAWRPCPWASWWRRTRRSSCAARWWSPPLPRCCATWPGASSTRSSSTCRRARQPAAQHRPAESALGRGDRLHATGPRPARRPQGPQHVPQGGCAGARHRREHEHLHLPQVRRAHRYLRPRRRPARGGEARPSLPRRRAARHGDPHTLRRGPADRGHGSGRPARARVPRHRRQHLGCAARRGRHAHGTAGAGDRGWRSCSSACASRAASRSRSRPSCCGS